MKESLLTVVNETGLHSRPADLFVRTARLYSCAIAVFNERQECRREEYHQGDLA